MEKNLENPAEKPKPSWEQGENEDEDDEANECEEEPNIAEDTVQVTVEPPKTNSPFSVFSKLSQFQSKFDRKLKSSPAASQAFKPVMSGSKSRKVENYSQDSSTVDLVLDSQQSTSALDTSSQSTDLDSSQRSIALCSIDTDSLSLPSLPNLPDDNDNVVTPKQQKTLTTFFYRKSTSGGKESRLETPSPKSSPGSSTSGSSSTKKGMLKNKSNDVNMFWP